MTTIKKSLSFVVVMNLSYQKVSCISNQLLLKGLSHPPTNTDCSASVTFGWQQRKRFTICYRL